MGRLPLSALVAAVLAAAACGSNAGNATVQGTVQGIGLSARDAIFTGLLQDDGRRHDAVVITDYANACDQSRDDASVPGATSLTLFLTQLDENGAVTELSPGDFPVDAPAGAVRSAVAVFQRDDASCAATLDDAASHAVEGRVTVTATKSDFLDGTFDLQLPKGDHLTGSFHAAICAQPTRKPPAICKAE